MTQTITRPDTSLIEAVRGIGTATIHEAGGQIGALPSYIKPVSPDWYVCGTALTVLSPPKDNLWLHRAIYHAQPGDVMVVDARGQGADGKPMPDLPVSVEFVRAVFETAPGEEPVLRESSDGTYFMIEVEAVTPPALRPL